MANDGAGKALLVQGRSLASPVGDDGAIIQFQADIRQRENLVALERMAAELRQEARARPPSPTEHS